LLPLLLLLLLLLFLLFLAHPRYPIGGCTNRVLRLLVEEAAILNSRDKVDQKALNWVAINDKPSLDFWIFEFPWWGSTLSLGPALQPGITQWF